MVKATLKPGQRRPDAIIELVSVQTVGGFLQVIHLGAAFLQVPQKGMLAGLLQVFCRLRMEKWVYNG